MGYETKCKARVTDASGTVREADCTALIETDELIIRGEARVRVARTAIQRVAVRAGVLTITAPTATIALSLGSDAAARWKKKIEEPPKRLIDKLDVKADAKVWLFDVDDDTLIGELSERTSAITRGRAASNCDVVFVDVDSERELTRIERARDATTESGAVWVIHRKGPAGVKDTTIFGAAKSLGLVATKVARISDRDTAEKLVRPLASRKKPKSK